MAETPVSLLERLRQRPDPESWRRLVDLYTPLIHTWLSRYFLQPADAEDLTQDVLGVVVRELPQFRRQHGPGSFRGWLRAIMVNRLRAFWRSRQSRPLATGDSDLVKLLEQLEAPGGSLQHLWDQEHDWHVAHKLLAQIEPEFQPTTWQAFRRVVLDGERAAVAAADLGISVNAVLIAKCRVLHRLRQEIQGFID